MTTLVPTDRIEPLVGAPRHATDHLGRAVSAEETVYVLHSQACRDSGIDLRRCDFSATLDAFGLDRARWSGWEDKPVRLGRNEEGLIPNGHADGPRRIQRKRTKGWRAPDGVVNVARPGRWGNPYPIDLYRVDYPHHDAEQHRFMATSDFRGLVEGRWKHDDLPKYPTVETIRAELHGKTLMCWCPPSDDGVDRCHADVLLRIAAGGMP